MNIIMRNDVHSIARGHILLPPPPQHTVKISRAYIARQSTASPGIHSILELDNTRSYVIELHIFKTFNYCNLCSMYKNALEEN